MNWFLFVSTFCIFLVPEFMFFKYSRKCQLLTIFSSLASYGFYDLLEVNACLDLEASNSGMTTPIHRTTMHYTLTTQTGSDQAGTRNHNSSEYLLNTYSVTNNVQSEITHLILTIIGRPELLILHLKIKIQEAQRSEDICPVNY